MGFIEDSMSNTTTTQTTGKADSIRLSVICGNLLASPIEAATEEYRGYFAGQEKDDFIFADHDDTGDTITGLWPLKSEDRKRNLRCLLYGARETGQLPGDLRSVILPDGSEFTIDQA